MNNSALIEALKEHLADLLEEEAEARRHGNGFILSGIQLARVKLEVLLQEHGHDRINTIDQK